MRSRDGNMQSIHGRLLWKSSTLNQLTSEAGRVVSQRKYRNSVKRSESPRTRRWIPQRGFVENDLRDEQTIFTAPAPPLSRHSLVCGHDDIPTRSCAQIADDACFDVDALLHQFDASPGRRSCQ